MPSFTTCLHKIKSAVAANPIISLPNPDSNLASISSGAISQPALTYFCHIFKSDSIIKTHHTCTVSLSPYRALYIALFAPSLTVDPNRPCDLIILDCPPSADLIVHNALYASDYVLLPTKPHNFDINGVGGGKK